MNLLGRRRVEQPPERELMQHPVTETFDPLRRSVDGERAGAPVAATEVGRREGVDEL